jgi:hypothetical protein
MIKKYVFPAVLMLIAAVPGSQVRDTAAQQDSVGAGYGRVALSSRQTDHMNHPEGMSWSGDQSRSGVNQSRRGGDQSRLGGDQSRRGGEQRSRWSWSEQISNEDLYGFLKEHVEGLTERLQKLEVDNPDQFKNLTRSLKELYGPVIQQMKRDPEAGALSLKKLQLRMRVQRSVYQVKHEQEEVKIEEAKKELTGYVAEMFDVVLAQERAQVAWMEERIKMRSDSTEDQQQVGDRGRGRMGDMGRGGRSGDQGRGRSGDQSRGQRGGEPDRRGRFSPDQFARELEQRKESIKAWEGNKDEIVQKRMEDLLRDHPNFPWGD